MNSAVKQKLLSPQELLDKYPEAVKMKWKADKLGVFYESGLLLGTRSKPNNNLLISEESFLELLSMAQSIPNRK